MTAAPPVRTHATQRNVVGVLDSGCGRHPWFDRAGDPVVDRSVAAQVGGSGGAPQTVAIGYTDPANDTEAHGDVSGPLDGALDPIAGHGTFICGLVHQASPDSNICAWRIVQPDGTVTEDQLIASLGLVGNLVTDDACGNGGRRIDVLNLSLGYYHETPKDEQFDPTLYELLCVIAGTGTVIVCSAGNDATDRPLFPAALWDWPDESGHSIVRPSPEVAPIVSVGALNPNGTVALFSNQGPWVRMYAPGAALVSTLPPFNGGYNAAGSREFEGRVRSSIDPDDFSCGFGVWSGTSFAAPVVAGRIAAAIDRMAAAGTSAERCERAKAAVEEVLAAAAQ